VRDVKKLTALFDACFRIQREACEAAGHHIPLVVENVCGAQKWVGRARWNFGSFYLWGDVPALMPMTKRAVKSARPNREGVMAWTTGHLEGYWESNNPDGVKTPGFRFDGSGGSFQTANVEQTGFKSQGMNWSNREIRGQDFTRVAAKQRDDTTSWHGQNPDGRKGVPPRTAGHWTNPAEHEGVKQHGSGREWFAGDGKISSMTSSKSNARKAASAAIAKIPFVLAQHVARSWKPANFIEQEVEAAA
jgi:hypothetical protein